MNLRLNNWIGAVVGGGIGICCEDASGVSMRGSEEGTTDADEPTSIGDVISRTGKIGSEEVCMCLKGNNSS